MSRWKECKLGEIATIVDCEHKTAPTVDSSEFVSVRTANISNGRIDFKNSNRVSEGTYEIWTKRMKPKEGDIILAREAPVGEVGWVPAGKKVCLGQRTVLIRVNESTVSPRYLLYYLVSDDVKYDLISRSTGSVVEHLNVKDIKDFDLKIHASLEEQQSIASILSTLDDKIDLLHRQNATLEAMAETLFRQWFVESEYDRTVGDLVSVESGYAFKSKDFREMGSYRVLKIKNISNGLVDTTNTDFVDEEVGAKVQEKFKVVAGDILIAMTGAEIGKLGIVPGTNERLLLNQRVGLLRERYSGSGYLAYIQLKSEFGRDYIDNAATGSAQPNISAGAIQRCPFPDVSDAKLKNYSSQLSPVYAKLVFNLGQIRTLQAIRDALLPRLMSGEITIL